MQEINKRNSRTWSRLGQRGTVCGVALPEMLKEQEGYYVMTADLAHLSGLDRIRQNFPHQFINVGIAEQNMIGVASGLAFEGNTVFVTTYATFLSMRGYEQIRHNLGYQRANVKLIGSASGLAMGMSGNTHYSYEDLAIMRVIPNMVVVSPADAAEAYQAVYCAANQEGPVYIRLSGNLNEPVIYSEPYDFQLGKGMILKQGEDIVLIATGGVVADALCAAERLDSYGISSAVINMHTIKPLDEEVIKRHFHVKWMVTVEEHNMIGGLGSAVAEFLASQKNSPLLARIGVEDQFLHPADHGFLKQKCGLDSDGIYKKIINILERTNK